METISRSVLSPAPVRCGIRNALPCCSRPRSLPHVLRRGGNKYEAAAAVFPRFFQVRAEGPSSEKQICLSSSNHKTEEVQQSPLSLSHHATCLIVTYFEGAPKTFAQLLIQRRMENAISSGDVDLPPIEPVVATISSSREINLAKQLKAIGAKMYGAFWCSHCFEQKQMFGKEALKYIEYVECYPEGYRRGVKLAAACSTANIRGFPTWVINGQQYSGEQEFDKLAELSGFSVAKVMK